MNIKVFKLTTGEEIIAEVVSESDSRVSVKSALSIVLQPSQQGISYGFVPWGNLVEEDKTLPTANIIYSGKPKDDLLNNYNSIFGGIMVAPKQLIT